MCLWHENQFEIEFPGNEQIEFFSQETYDFHILGNETLIIAGYEDTKISIFHWLAVKLKMMIYAKIIPYIHPNLFIQKCKHFTK